MKIILVSNKVNTFSLAYRNEISILLKLGHEIVWMANFSGFIGDRNEIPCKTIHMDIFSYPFHKANLKAFLQLSDVIKEIYFDAMICTTPIGGFIGRLVAKKNKVPLVVYSAHGFLFYKGAPLINRTVYKWQEQIMARWTDYIITINDEDYIAANKYFKIKKDQIFKIHGAGVTVGNKRYDKRALKRKELGISEDAFILISAGFLNPNKNNKVIINAMNILKNNNIYYLLCGEGEEKEYLNKLVDKYELGNNVKFLGYRTDIIELLSISDVFVMPSFREGVPRALLEAMDLGIPCIGSDTRGIRELIGINKEGGLLCNPKSSKEFASAINYLYCNPSIFECMATRNQKEVARYSSEQVKQELYVIYSKIFR